LARLGLALTRSGGRLVQASCSARVDVDALSEALSRAARQRGARIREIRRTGHPVDHPIGFRFGGYLKALYVSVLDSGTKN
ncbi:MAG: class I SAM-dependent rRNA methyltransferase, partial [Ilumatobacter sp.]